MSTQLAFVLDDVPGSDAAVIAARVTRDLECLNPRPDDDADPNARAHDSLVAGWTMLLDWLDGRRDLPADWRAWPCCACFAKPGEPCDMPNRYRRDAWLPEDRDEMHHLKRGLDGTWRSAVGGAP